MLINKELQSLVEIINKEIKTLLKYLDIQDEINDDLNSITIQQSYIQKSSFHRNHSISLPDLENLARADWNAIHNKASNDNISKYGQGFSKILSG